MKLKLILITVAILVIIWPKIIYREPDWPPYWRALKDYQDIIVSLHENNFTDQEIDSMFYAADSGRTEYLKRKTEEKRIFQIFFTWLKQKYPFIPDDLLKKALKNQKPTLKLLSKESIEIGKKFLKEHLEQLKHVEKNYGVQKEIIVAILRVETCTENFGDNLGQYHTFTVFDSIICTTKNPTLKEWIKEEMVALFIICRNNNLDIRTMMGSSIGAIGLSQFMPTSYLCFAVDGNSDGIINLFEWEDAMASTALYLRLAGWRKYNSIRLNKIAIWHYNHSWNYTNTIIKYARKIGFKH